MLFVYQKEALFWLSVGTIVLRLVWLLVVVVVVVLWLLIKLPLKTKEYIVFIKSNLSNLRAQCRIKFSFFRIQKDTVSNKTNIDTQVINLAELKFLTNWAHKSLQREIRYGCFRGFDGYDVVFNGLHNWYGFDNWKSKFSLNLTSWYEWYLTEKSKTDRSGHWAFNIFKTLYRIWMFWIWVPQ